MFIKGLKMTNISVKIQNFTQDELKCKCGCGRFNVDSEFLIRLQSFRYLLNLPMVITSCCRCIKHNKNEDGVQTSLHQCETKQASAVDFYCGDMSKAYELACKSGLFNEIIWYKSKNFMHIGLDRNQKGDYFVIK